MNKKPKKEDLNILIYVIFLILILIFIGGVAMDYLRFFTSIIEVFIAILLWFGYGKVRNRFVKVVIVISIVALFIIGAYNFILSLK